MHVYSRGKQAKYFTLNLVKLVSLIMWLIKTRKSSVLIFTSNNVKNRKIIYVKVSQNIFVNFTCEKITSK